MLIQKIETAEEFMASWEQAPPPPLKYLRELSLTEKVSIFFSELKKSIRTPSRKGTRFFPKYCFNQTTWQVINSTHPNYDLVLSIGGELRTYLKELAYAEQIRKVVIFVFPLQLNPNKK